MKKNVIVLAFLLVCVSNLFAQGEKKPSFYLNTGLSLPSSPDDFSDYWNLGLNLGGGIGFPLNPTLTLQGYVDLNNLGLNGDALLEDFGFEGSGVSIDGGSSRILTVAGNLKVNLGTPDAQVSPYLTGGVGFFKITISDVNASAPGSTLEINFEGENALYLGFGAGLDIKLNEKAALFVESKYSIGFTEEESTKFFPIKIGIKIN